MAAFKRIPLVYWVALALPLIAVSQLFTGTTLPNTADGVFHTHRIFAMTEQMQSGTIYPRWVPWFHLGYGYPVFNYYASFSTWLGGLLGLLGISAAVAFQLITAGSWIAGALGMVRLGKLFLPDTGALLAAALWVYAPVRFHEYWIQGSLSHVVATALIPWVFVLVSRLLIRPTVYTAIGLGIAVGLLILSHQPTMYLMALYTVGVGLLILGWRLIRGRAKLVKTIMYAALSFGVALGVAAILLLPLLTEIDAIVINDAPTGNIPGLLASNAIPFRDLFTQPQLLDHTDLSATIPHSYGLLGGVLALLGLLALLWKRLFPLAGLLALGLAVSVFLVTPSSLHVWESIPLMDQLRFPWRVMRVGIVPLALLGAAVVLVVPLRWRTLTATGLVALSVLAALPVLYPTNQTVDFGGQSAMDMIRYESRTGAVGGTSYNEFKPAWGERVPLDEPDNLLAYVENPARLYVESSPDVELERLNDACWQVAASEATSLVIRQFYFPGWQATLDGQKLTVSAEPTFGLLRVALQEDAAGRLCVAYSGTSTQHLAEWITLATVLLLLCFGIWSRIRSHQQIEEMSPPPSESVSTRWALGMIAVFGLLALVNGVWIGPQTMAFRLQSPVDDPAYMQVAHPVSYEAAYDLLGYTLHTTEAAPGETLELTLYWRPQAVVNGSRFYPIVQLSNLTGTAAWASAEMPYVGLSPYQHTPETFISQRVRLNVFADAPSYAGLITVQLMDRAVGLAVPASMPESSVSLERVPLSTVIPIIGEAESDVADTGYRIAEAIVLADASIRQGDDQILLDLTWVVAQPLPVADVQVFIHGLDAAGEIVAQVDAVPFNGNYPVQYWRSGQILRETYTLPADDAITALGLGMYSPDERFAITQDGQSVPDGRIILPID